MGLDKIKDTIMAKVQAEAEEITNDARQRAQDEVDKANRQQEEKLQQEKRKILAEVEEESARILAQASIKSRQTIASTKADIITDIVANTRKGLSQVSSNESRLLDLIKEATEGLGGSKGRIYVSSKDAKTAKSLLETDKGLSDRITEIKETDILGGVIAEDVNGKLRIDNTYETRLEMLLPRLLPEMSKELFQSE